MKGTFKLQSPKMTFDKEKRKTAIWAATGRCIISFSATASKSYIMIPPVKDNITRFPSLF